MYQDPRQAEVGHLDAVADQQQVLRLDVPVLNPLRLSTLGGMAGLVQVVDPLRRVQEMLEDLGGRDPPESLTDGLPETVQEGPFGQLHRDDEGVVALPGAEGGQQVGMAELADDL